MFRKVELVGCVGSEVPCGSAGALGPRWVGVGVGGLEMLESVGTRLDIRIVGSGYKMKYWGELDRWEHE